MENENIERWITVKGNHIPILKGQTEEEAINNFIDKNQAFEIDIPKERKEKSYYIWYDDEHHNGTTIQKDQYEDAEKQKWWKPGYSKEIRESDIDWEEQYNITADQAEKMMQDALNNVDPSKVFTKSDLRDALWRDLQMKFFDIPRKEQYGADLRARRLVNRDIFDEEIDAKWKEIEDYHIEKGKEALNKFTKIKDKSQPAILYGVNRANFYSSDAYSENCQRCVSTLEARFRGYNVQAKPLPPKDDLQSGKGYARCFIGWEKQFIDNDDGHLGKTGKTVKRGIEQEILKAGNGSRFIVRIGWKGHSTGHVFNAINDNGTVRFIDGQSNDDDVGNYFDVNGVGIKPLETQLLRVDNLEFNETVDRYFEENKDFESNYNKYQERQKQRKEEHDRIEKEHEEFMNTIKNGEPRMEFEN